MFSQKKADKFLYRKQPGNRATSIVEKLVDSWAGSKEKFTAEEENSLCN